MYIINSNSLFLLLFITSIISIEKPKGCNFYVNCLNCRISINLQEYCVAFSSTRISPLSGFPWFRFSEETMKPETSFIVFPFPGGKSAIEDCFPLVIQDLAALPSDCGILAEGFGFLPDVLDHGFVGYGY